MAELLQRIADGGDVEAFRTLFRDYAPRVKSYMLRQGADPTTAEELAQETLLTVWRKACLYSGDKGSATTWIFTIARNLRIDKLRRESMWVALPNSYDEEPATDPLPDDVVAEAERKVRVRQALSTLTPNLYEVVALSYIEGLSHSQISERLGLPIGTVKTRMRLAYFAIREELKGLN
jgi:RNA polymerase sigma-70 factor, ECF subfamily